MEKIQLLYFGLIHATIIVGLLCAFMLFFLHMEGERSRKVLAFSWILIVVMFAGRMLFMYMGNPQLDYILPIEPLVGGLATITLLTLYPAEVIHPGWLKPRTLLLMFSPFLVMLLAVEGMRLAGVEFHRYESLRELWANASEPEVWIRFLFMIVIYSYSFCLFLIPRKAGYGHVDRQWIRVYCTAEQGISLLFAFNMLIGMYPSGVFHQIYFLLFIAYATYQELYLRLFIAPSSVGAAPAGAPVIAEPAPLPPEPGHAASNLLWHQLETYMEQERPWLNPDLTLPALASAVCSNRTTLSALIRTHGYDSFYDYIAAYRVNAFCRMVERKEVVTIQEAFFAVGFRSRTTAFSQFRRLMGVSPSDYMKNNISKTSD